jgi:hypothetical protein
MAMAARAICTVLKVGLGPVRAVPPAAIFAPSGTSTGVFSRAVFTTQDVGFSANLDACFRHGLF